MKTPFTARNPVTLTKPNANSHPMKTAKTARSRRPGQVPGAFIAALLAAPTAQAVDILSQNFDTDPVNYTLTGAQTAGTSYFALSNAGGITLNPNLNGAAGVYFTMQAPAANPCQLTFDPVSIADYEDLKLSIALAGGTGVETADFIRAVLDTNGDGTYETTLFNFKGTGNLPYNDTSLGNLSTTFSTFSGIVLPAGDGTLRLRIETWSSSLTNENVGFDSILISGTTSGVTSIASADWNTPAAWSTLTVPTASSAVRVDPHTVTIDSAVSDTPATCNRLTLSGGGSVAVTGQSLTVAGTQTGALNTTGGALTLDATSTLNIARASTSSSFAGLTVAAGTVLNVTGELTVDASRNLTGAMLNTPMVTLAGGSTLTASALNVPNAGSLKGDGAVTSPVSVASGGKVSPGTDTSIGAITVSGLTLDSGSILPINISNPITLDQISVTGSNALTINGGLVSLYGSTSNATFSTPGTYNLIAYSGSIDGDIANLSVQNKVAGKRYVFGTAGGFVTLVISQGALWNGGSNSPANANWSDPLNWSGGVPSAGDILPFTVPANGLTTLNNNIAGGSFASLQFESGAPAFTLNGNGVALTGDFSANAVLNNSSNVQTVNMPVTLGDSAAITATSGAVVFDTSGTIDNNGNFLTVQGTQPVTLKGAMTGGGGVTMAANARLNLGADDAVSGTLTINAGGTLNNTRGSALTLTNNPAQAWNGGFTFTGTNDMNMGTGAVTMGASLRATVGGSTLTVGGGITGTGRILEKNGTGTLVLTGAGTSLSRIGITAGTVVIGSGASVTMTTPLSQFDPATGWGNIDGGKLVVSSASLTVPGADLAHDNQSGKVVIEGTSTVTVNGEWLTGRNMGHGSLTVKDNAVINGGGNILRLGRDNIRDNYVGLFNNAQATFGPVIVFESSGYGEGGAGSGSVLQVADSASLTATSMIVGQNSFNPNTNVKYGYAQVTQSGSSTVTVNGNIAIATTMVKAADFMNGTYNLNGGELKTSLITNGTGAVRGTATFNLHGGTLTYNNTVPETDFIRLTAGSTAGSGSLYLYETSTISDNGQNVTINQPILSPNTGEGLTAIAVAAPFGNYFMHPEVYISGGGGSGATAIPVLNDAGQVTAVTVTNPGVGYTSKPTVQLWYNGGASHNFAAGDITTAPNAYTGGLTKKGSGTLTLAGANTYTGATTVSEGTLALVGGSQQSPVTVSPGASLAFDVASPTTSASTYDFMAGSKVRIIGTPNASIDLTTSSGITGTPVLDPPVPGYRLIVDGTTLKLVSGTPFQITSIVRDPGTGEVTITFPSTDGAIYTVEATTDLLEWTELNDSVAGQAGETNFTDDDFAINPSPKEEVFYRVSRNP